MNPNSPGHDSLNTQIEMIDIHDAQEPLNPHQNGHIRPEENDSDEEDDDARQRDDDGSRGLLSGSVRKTSFEVSPAKIWPQVKGIVVEVSSEFVCLSSHSGLYRALRHF